MPASCCTAADNFFDSRYARREHKRYVRRGALPSTERLISALSEKELNNRTLLDIGGGVGAIQHALLARGVKSAVHVDASLEFLRVAQAEAVRRKIRQNISIYHGDFLGLTDKVNKADIVTLDRVICCYPDMESLVRGSIDQAKWLYGLVYPRGTVFNRVGILLFNIRTWMMRKKHRSYFHKPSRILDLVTSSGFKQIFHSQTMLWDIVVFERNEEGHAG